MWLRLPESWPTPVTTVVFLVLLTTLDLLGSAAAKEAVERRSALIAAIGAALFVAMFFVFASALQISGLVVVTVGWCVLVQVGVLLMDRLHYGVHLTPGKYLAVIVAVAAQAYLVAGPSGIPEDRAVAPVTAPTAPAAAPVVVVPHVPKQPRHLAEETQPLRFRSRSGSVPPAPVRVHTVWIYTGDEESERARTSAGVAV